MEKKNNGFTYTYSAVEQEEVRMIRDKYVPREESKLDRLRRLDESVTKKGTIISIMLGVIGCLIMGFGMSLVMVWQGDLFIPGIIIGLLGICIVALAYPAYRMLVKKERERVAPEIIRLTDELMNE
ncbi:MAG: hypothetical protein J6L69_10720 [Lachnospiraceae bacterium]|nr:hypothetical protein [Lachnospiraceae bacterium]